MNAPQRKYQHNITNLVRIHHNHPILNLQAHHIPVTNHVILVRPSILPVPWNLSAVRVDNDNDEFSRKEV